MTDKKTGLGDSLLLQRTDPDGADEPPKDAQTSGAAKRPEAALERPSTTPQPTPEQLRDRCTIYLDPDINTQLDLVARIQRKQRSEVVTELLRANLPKYRVDLE